MAIYLDYFITGQSIQAAKVPQNIESYECMHNEVKYMIWALVFLKDWKKTLLHCTFPPVDTILYSIAKDRMPNGFTGTAFKKYIPEIINEHTTEPYSKMLKFPVQIWFEMQIFYYKI